MAPANALRCKPTIWAGLKHGYAHSHTLARCRRLLQPRIEPSIRLYAHTATAHTFRDDTNQSSLHAFTDLPQHTARRKSGPSPSPSSPAVLKQRKSEPLRDIKYYASLRFYPIYKNYAKAVSSRWKRLFDRPPPIHMINDVLARLLASGSVSQRSSVIMLPDGLVWHLYLTFQMGKRRIQVVGMGTSPDGSQTAAFMGLLHQLHRFGFLRTLLHTSQEVSSTNLNDSSMSSGFYSTGKLHVHNYAARILSTPVINVECLKDSDEVKATVTIPKSELQASAAAQTQAEAEALAFEALKRKIELHHEQDRLVLNLQSEDTVNLDNANKILDVYRFDKSYGNFRKFEELVPGPDAARKWYSTRLFWDNLPLTGTHVMPDPSQARQLATLEAAVSLVQQNSNLFQLYQDSVKANHGFVPRRVRSTFASLDNDVTQVLKETIESADLAELDSFQLERFDAIADDLPFGRASNLDVLAGDFHHTVQSLSARNNELKSIQEFEMQDPLRAREKLQSERLPIVQHKTEILGMLKNHDQCIVVGSTGSGKSTQVPQLILDDAIREGRGALCNVICVQPRRLAAVSLALTVCAERAGEVGDTVGYWIGGDRQHHPSRGGSISYLTPEILSNELEMKSDMANRISHIIIDEIHERQEITDRLLATIKVVFSQRMSQRLPVPKLVLMSATVESDLFERYFEKVSQDGTVIRPPFINVPGRSFKTEMHFLDSYERKLEQPYRKPAPPAESTSTNWQSSLEEQQSGSGRESVLRSVVGTVIHLAETTSTGSILVFLPGANDMRAARDMLFAHKRISFNNPNKYQILMLHSANTEDLVRATEPKPGNVRRILLSTNIAETSLTLPDVEYVVDSGLRRSLGKDVSSYIKILSDEHISKASLLQRAGRAGRVKEGQYFGAFPSPVAEGMQVFSKSEPMSQDRLQDLYLRSMIYFPEITPAQFFESFLHPPSLTSIRAAEQRLQDLGASVDRGVSTIGCLLSYLRLPPALARMVLLGIMFHCLDRAIILAAILSNKYCIFGHGSFETATSAHDRRRKKARFARGSSSDVLAELYAYEEFAILDARNSERARAWAADNELQWPHLISTQLYVERTRKKLVSAGLLGSRDMPKFDSGNHSEALLKLIILSGLYPRVAISDYNHRLITQSCLIVEPNPGSLVTTGEKTNSKTFAKVRRHHKDTMYTYSSLFTSSTNTTTLYMGDVTPISPLMLALLSKNLKMRPGSHNELLIDDSIPLRFSGNADAANVFLGFKKSFDTAILAGMQDMWEVVRSRRRNKLQNGVTSTIVSTVQELLEYEEGQSRRRLQDSTKLSLGSEEKRSSWTFEGMNSVVAASHWKPVEVNPVIDSPERKNDDKAFVLETVNDSGSRRQEVIMENVSTGTYQPLPGSPEGFGGPDGEEQHASGLASLPHQLDDVDYARNDGEVLQKKA